MLRSIRIAHTCDLQCMFLADFNIF